MLFNTNLHSLLKKKKKKLISANDYHKEPNIYYPQNGTEIMTTEDEKSLRVGPVYSLDATVLDSPWILQWLALC